MRCRIGEFALGMVSALFGSASCRSDTPVAPVEPAVFLVPSCDPQDSETPRFRELQLRGEAPHLGSLSEPGYYNVVVIGASWCGPCHLVLEQIPRWLAAYPNLVVTYIDIVDEGESVKKFAAMNGILSIPYAYLSNECGVSQFWLKPEASQSLDAKIAAKLQALLGPIPDENAPLDHPLPHPLSMAPRAAPSTQEPSKVHTLEQKPGKPRGQTPTGRRHQP